MDMLTGAVTMLKTAQPVAAIGWWNGVGDVGTLWHPSGLVGTLRAMQLGSDAASCFYFEWRRVCYEGRGSRSVNGRWRCWR